MKPPGKSDRVAGVRAGAPPVYRPMAAQRAQAAPPRYVPSPAPARPAPPVYRPVPAAPVRAGQAAQPFYVEIGNSGTYKWVDDKLWDPKKYVKSPNSTLLNGWVFRNLWREVSVPPKPQRAPKVKPTKPEVPLIALSEESFDDEQSSEEEYDIEDLAKGVGVKIAPKKAVKPKRKAQAQAAVVYAPREAPEQEIANEANRVIDRINNSLDTGDHLTIWSNLPRREMKRLHAKLRQWHNEAARGRQGLRFYVGTDLTRGLHVTLHKWGAKGDTFQTIANYHIEMT